MQKTLFSNHLALMNTRTLHEREGEEERWGFYKSLQKRGQILQCFPLHTISKLNYLASVYNCNEVGRSMDNQLNNTWFLFLPAPDCMTSVHRLSLTISSFNKKMGVGGASLRWSLKSHAILTKYDFFISQIYIKETFFSPFYSLSFAFDKKNHCLFGG